MEIVVDNDRFNKCQNKLKEMYAEYYNNKNQCKYYSQCKSSIDAKCCKGYNSSYATKVGEWYYLKINGIDIRIVFIGKEGLGKNEKLDAPTRLTEYCGRVNLHYQETYKMLCYIYNHNPQKPYKNQQGAVLKTFALTNRYRCAFKYKDSDKSAINSDIQNTYCLEILKKEIEILSPTIIIMQYGDLKANQLFGENIVKIMDGLYYCQKENIYIIETIHPSNYGKWYNKFFPIFKKNVDILKEKGVLPKEDVCILFDELENNGTI